MMGHLSPPHTPPPRPMTSYSIPHSTTFYAYSMDIPSMMMIGFPSIYIYVQLFIYLFIDWFFFLSLRVCTSKDRNTTWWKSAFYFSFFFCIAWPRIKDIKWHIFRCTSQWMISLNWQCLQNKSKNNNYIIMIIYICAHRFKNIY